ncbi:hypothetical protein BKG93_04660 [Rodentibacter ratti]|uniref:Transferrin-binding protein B C-lobe/N-lobe beta barrel domain-containing protein n=1 Tax=Rodentibacter ratti TaxID=1906745 RepID=A0A1V3L681_9PAST|nr:hypothetical protein [Rodentibacter ratti]OOF85311.1 hypothetical protein BKG93_04660 [Rodentibacter ratti]
MNVTMKKTAAAAFVVLMLAGCGSSNDGDYFSRQAAEPVPTVQAIDYSKQSVQQLEQSATTAQKVLSDSQAKLTQVETQITEINRRITTLNEEIRVLEKAEKPDANALKEKRDALAEAKQSLTVQNKILVVAQQDVKQAQINVTNVQNILIEKKNEQNKPPVLVVPDNPSQPSQPTQPEQPSEPEQPSQPSQPEQPEQPSQPAQPAQPTEPEQPTEPTQPEQPQVTGDKVLRISTWGPYDVVESNKGEFDPDFYQTYVDNSVYSSRNIYNGFKVDLNKLSALGIHEGILTYPYRDGIEDKTGELNYIISNQPYSTYGIFYNKDAVETMATDDSDNIVMFGIAKFNHHYDDTKDITGSATYKGDVIARIKTGTYQYDSNKLDALGSIVYQKDGTIEFTADFDNKKISGLLNSDSIGEVRLRETDIVRHTGGAYRGGVQTQENTPIDIQVVLIEVVFKHKKILLFTMATQKQMINGKVVGLEVDFLMVIKIL